MGFRMFAHGLRGFRRRSGRARRAFNYLEPDCLDQGDFEPPKLLSMIPSSPTVMGVVENTVGTAESHIGGTTVKGIYRIAEMVFAHSIVTEVNLLAMHGQSGRISVYCHESNMLWADSNSFDTCYLWGANPGREFLRKIAPGLKKTGLNNFGVLAEIARVLSKYDSDLPRSAEANLRMEIRH